MIKTTPLQTALIAALLGSVALVGCKKKEESTDTNAAPAATAPAEPAAPAPMMEMAAPMQDQAISADEAKFSKELKIEIDKFIK